MTVTAAVLALDDVLRELAPRTLAALGGPCPQEELDALRAELGPDWSEDLDQLLREHNGSEAGPPGDLLLGHHLLPANEILSRRRMLVQIDLQEMQAMVTESQSLPAGDYAPGYTARFVPVAGHGGGSTLYLDMRAGPRRGCIGTWIGEDNDDYEPELLWESLEHLLTDITQAIRNQTATLDGGQAILDDGAVTWLD
ncbi:SMI1/KNR4 family protein [Motilibacter deserti]|uniref:SMI1/KNR4 family protein n=1 Tax=Motilibacter deserti TaxID=2714956 RepID=A0ABX0GZZ7_9ACTN|nr:SMI1/KNR4 family protein [Motilibacter deserti]NHC15140.1 SMI1/KNR4 family protein [Motilibacter deserti]